MFVHDTAQGKAGSNEWSILTANRPPDAVTLSAPTPGRNSIRLDWTQCGSPDFRAYKVVKGLTSDAVRDTLTTYLQKEQISYTFFTADTTRYFFKVVVFDKGVGSNRSLSTDSNVVSGQATLR